MEKITFKDLVAKKLQRENDKLKIKEIEVKSIGKALLFKRPSDDILLDIIDEVGDGSNTRGILEAYKKLIYLTCDALQNPELHKELEIVDPYDTVSVIFDIQDTMQIGADISDFIGFGNLDDQVKN